MKNGISLVALIINIVVISILSVAIIFIVMNAGIIQNSNESRFKNDIATFQHDLTLTMHSRIISTLGNDVKPINETNGNVIKNEYIYSFNKNYFDKIIIKNSVLTYTGEDKNEKRWFSDLSIDGIIEESDKDDDTLHSLYSKLKGVNIPILNTGMSPIIYDDSGNAKVVDKSSDQWYEYVEQITTTEKGGTSKWANSQTEDGSSWVWIPRFAYKLDPENEKVDIIFLVGKTNNYYDKDNIYNNVLPEGYSVHPAFIDDSKNNYAKHGWDEELSGIWIAKYEAGYNMDTDLNNIRDSNVRYSNTTKNYYYPNMQVIKYPIKYPVFKGNVYSVKLSLNECYELSKKLAYQNNPYGIEDTSKPHLMKDVEWGALAYLAHSKYGRNSTNISLNKTNVTSIAPNSSITATGKVDKPNGRESNELDTSEASAISNNYLQSSTGNVYGVYDLVGGLAENVAAYVPTGQRLAYLNSIRAETDKKYFVKYNLGDKADGDSYPTAISNYNKNIDTDKLVKGDAVLEIAREAFGNNTWISSISEFPVHMNPVLSRGARFHNHSNSSIFSFSAGNAMDDGFRVVIMPSYNN